MSLSRETMLELMALADGELEGTAKERVERLAAENEEARRVVESMRGPALRAWLGAALSARAPASDGIADAVMAKLGRAAGPARHAAARARAGRRDRWLGPRFGSRVAVVSALAVAAGVALFVVTDRMAHVAPGAMGPAPSLAPGVGKPEVASPALGVEVEEVDSASHVSIFEIPAMANASASSSVVVWIDDDSEEK
jgi:anti-sigma factor RsiW